MARIGRVADTSWLYALFDRDDAHHEAARGQLVAPMVTLVPSAILAETLDLVRFRGGRAAALRVQRELEAFPHFDLDHPVDARAVARLWHEHPRLSMHDAHVVALVLATDFEIATFDQAQRTACRM